MKKITSELKMLIKMLAHNIEIERKKNQIQFELITRMYSSEQMQYDPEHIPLKDILDKYDYDSDRDIEYTYEEIYTEAQNSFLSLFNKILAERPDGKQTKRE